MLERQARKLGLHILSALARGVRGLNAVLSDAHGLADVIRVADGLEYAKNSLDTLLKKIRISKRQLGKIGSHLQGFSHLYFEELKSIP